MAAVSDLSSPLTAARSNRTAGKRRQRARRARLLFPHHVNYHLEHHLYPAVPHYRLPRLHRLLAEKGALDGAEVRDLGATLAIDLRRARAARHRSSVASSHERDRPAPLRRLAVLGEGSAGPRHEDLRWRSVDVPVVMPKPDVVALTGGYRRTPFMQIGADVYCDSALMCRVIDRLAPEPPLYPDRNARDRRDRRAVGRHVALLDRRAFHDAAGAVAHLLPAPPGVLRAFAADRAAMNPAMRRAPLGDGAAMLARLRRPHRSHAGRRAAVPARCAALDRRLLGGAVDLVHPARAAVAQASRSVPAPARVVRADCRIRPRRARGDVQRRRDRAGARIDALRRLRRGAGGGRPLAAGMQSASRPPTTRTTKSAERSSASTPTKS